MISGGKTTALARVFSYLRERNFDVITVPEVFTVLASNGMSGDFFATGGMEKIIQGTVLDVQLSLEDGIEKILRAKGKPAVMICDRGTMDGAAYIPKDTFERIMVDRNTDVVQLRDNRYDAIFHLVTCADGASSYYTLVNNKVRTETVEEALAMDLKSKNTWVGHPHLYVLDNHTLFEGKMNRLVNVISKLVGLPSGLKRRSAKFLLKSKPIVDNFPPEMVHQTFEVEKVYLQQSDKRNPDNYSFIRRRTNVDSKGRLVGSVYQLTSVQFNNEEVIEHKRIISQREYSAAYFTRDQSRHVVQQRRISFLYENQSFQVHVYVQPAPDLCILHAQVEQQGKDDQEEEVKLPPFLNVDRQVNDSKEDEAKYGAYSISLMNK
jgi:hypothetical protein